MALGALQIVRKKVEPRGGEVAQMGAVKEEREAQEQREREAPPERREAHQQRLLARDRWNSHLLSMLD